MSLSLFLLQLYAEIPEIKNFYPHVLLMTTAENRFLFKDFQALLIKLVYV